MTDCKCSHGELEHPGGECVRPLCGCLRYRPQGDPGDSWLDAIAKAGPSIWAAKNAATETGA